MTTSGSFLRFVDQKRSDRFSALFLVVWFLLFSELPSDALEPVRLDVPDDYHVGEEFSARLVLPPGAGSFHLLLRDPDGKLMRLLPNDYESPAKGGGGKHRLFPDPVAAYEIILAKPGDFQLFSIRVQSGDLATVTWPGTLPSASRSALSALLSSMRDAGMKTQSEAVAVSTVKFFVKTGNRPQGEILPLSDEGVLDGPNNPHFASGGVSLSTTDDYRKLWRWAKLLNSPAHRHQRFLVECHASESGNRKANLELSEARADETLNYLVENCGIHPVRLTPSGKGDFEPLLPVDGEDSKAVSDSANNRVVLVLDNTAGARHL